MLRGCLELLFFVCTDVLLFALRKAVDEERSSPTPKTNDGPIAFGLLLPRTSNPLLDDFAAQVSIDLALFCPAYGLFQGVVPDPFFSGESLEPLRFKDPQSMPLANITTPFIL
jgi:hypothetical protein